MVFLGPCIRRIPHYQWKETHRLFLTFPAGSNTALPPPRFQRIGDGKVISQSSKGFLQVPQPSNSLTSEDQEISWRTLWPTKGWKNITLSMKKSQMIIGKNRYGIDAKSWCSRIWKVRSKKVSARYSSTPSSWWTTVRPIHYKPCHPSYSIPGVVP